jgi:nucleotide-binding universal stress UspA family protein
MFNKILIPLDGSELAERALEPAFALARQAEGEVLLVRVSALERLLVPDLHGIGGYGLLWPDQSLARAEEEGAAYLKSVQTRKAPQNLPVRAEVFEGGVAEVIMDTAAAEKVDLIVMSSHGYSGITRWVLGSVAERVLGGAPCPVLVVRSPRPLRHVLIPLDGSPLSEQAVAPGLAVAAAFGAEVTLFRAIPKVDVWEMRELDQAEHGLGWCLAENVRKEAEDYLSNVIAAHPHPGLEAKLEVMFDPAAESILEYAETHEIDLIAMSTHGRTGLARWVYGSVTAKVLHGSRHSMLIVRPAKHELSTG